MKNMSMLKIKNPKVECKSKHFAHFGEEKMK